MFVLVGMAELTAAGIYMQYWFPMFQRGFGLPPSLLSSTPLTW